MVETLPGNQLLEFSHATGGAFLAFIVVGALSFVIIQIYATMTVGGNEVTSAGGSRAPAAEDSANASGPAGRPVRASELSVANGEDGASIYIALKDPYSSRVVVFDMSKGREFYGPGGPYHCFAARDATYGLAKSSLDPSAFNCSHSDLTAAEQETHIQWYTKYTEKYDVVGWLIRDGAPDFEGADDAGSVAPSESNKKNA
jgi:Cytochrome b5-like Heme/Steroid binding domain